MTRFYTTEGEDLESVADLLRHGELVALPTETVYGLAGDALREEVVRKIFEVKVRPFINPLIVHVAGLEQVAEIAEAPLELEDLAVQFWPGPLTVVLPKKAVVPDLVTAGLPSVAVRMPAHPFMREVLRRSRLFLAAPSANPFGYLSPTCAAHVLESFGEKIVHIVDGGQCAHGIESTVLGLQDPQNPVLLRPGPIGRRQMEAVLGRPIRKMAGHPEAQAQQSPGNLKKHYSPHTPVELLPHGVKEISQSDELPTACVFYSKGDTSVTMPSFVDAFWLTEDGDSETAARNLFTLLRKLDGGQRYARILVEEAPDAGLGNVVNDRLRRAAQ